MRTKEHLADIDFRTRLERQATSKEEFINWYKQLSEACLRHTNNQILTGQLTMLSSVLWYLLSEKDYRKLTRRKTN